jgi:hypothetical protein
MSEKEPRYNVVAMYRNRDTEAMDKHIEKVAKRKSSGSGFGMDGRDLSFWYHRRASAIDAYERIKNIRGVRCEIWDTKTGEKIAV